MSRRVGGRFATTTASDQRQLAAPVHKWKKAWVTPTGLAPESSYKVGAPPMVIQPAADKQICKWVKVEEGDDDLDEAFSQVPDGEDDDEAIDEDGQDEEDKDADTPAAGLTGPSTPAIETPLETPELELALPTNPAAPNEPSSLSKPPINAETPSAPPSIAVTPAPVEVADPVDPIPSNAIELTNVAPGHVEEGTGDLGNEAGMEVHVPEAEVAPTAVPAVDEDVTMDGGDEPQVPVTEDAGLVHGELEPPIAAFAVTEGDHPPPEMEKEE